MSDVKGNRIFEGKFDRKNVVKVLEIIEKDSDPKQTIVIYRPIRLMLKPFTAMNAYFLDYEDFKGSKKTYMNLAEFEAVFRWFVEDPETQARIREGFYDIN